MKKAGSPANKMATRILCFIMALAFLVSVVGYGVYWIVRNIQEETEVAKTSEERAAEQNESLLKEFKNLGTLEAFEPLGDIRLQERLIEDLVTVDTGLEVLSTDVATVSYKYALAQSGQIFIDSTADSATDGTRTLAAARFCEVWPESLEGMRIGAKRRLSIPGVEAADCLGASSDQWPSDQDLIIEVEMVALADRAVLAALQPLAERLTELGIEDIEIGDGEEEAASGDTVKVDYIGVLASDGSVFDAGNGATFPLTAGVIAGFSEGIAGMKVGGIRHISVPAELGYGAAGSGAAVPSDADLIFRVELISIESQGNLEEA